MFWNRKKYLVSLAYLNYYELYNKQMLFPCCFIFTTQHKYYRLTDFNIFDLFLKFLHLPKINLYLILKSKQLPIIKTK